MDSSKVECFLKMGSKILKSNSMITTETPSLPVLLGLDADGDRPAIEPRSLVTESSRVSVYVKLAKPEVTLLVLVATGLGFMMASPFLSVGALGKVLLGTGLLAIGTATLNHCLERNDDAKMHRTAQRPLPAGQLSAWEAYGLGVCLCLSGTIYLALQVNQLTSVIGLMTTLLYLAVYTPLKRKSSWCTFVGAFPGAAPVLMGWAAATDTLLQEAWVLFAVLFIWQFPHFLAIAWMYREDYARAGMLMLPTNDPEGNVAFRQVLGYSFALVPVSLTPFWMGMAGTFYLIAALLLGCGFLYYSYRFYSKRTKQYAKLMLHVTVVYLPLLFSMMVLDKIRV